MTGADASEARGSGYFPPPRRRLPRRTRRRHAARQRSVGMPNNAKSAWPQIFVAVPGASSFTFARASWTQTLPDWIEAHERAFAAIGGTPDLLVPDNTKTPVIKTCLYAPQVNRTYADMAAHYDTAILPARPRKPGDKRSAASRVGAWRQAGTLVRIIMNTENCTDRTASTNLDAIVFVSPKLSQAKWLVTSLSPSSSKISRRSVRGDATAALLRIIGQAPRRSGA